MGITVKVYGIKRTFANAIQAAQWAAHIKGKKGAKK